MYVHQLAHWTDFIWNAEAVLPMLGKVRHKQGLILGKMGALGFRIQENAWLDTLTLDVTKSSEIEGEQLNAEQVRSSIARRLGIDMAGSVPAGRDVEGVVELMLDATQRYGEVLSTERLFGWHAALFPTGRSGMYRITVGDWRPVGSEPMQVVSGAFGREKVHFEAPEPERVPGEMMAFLDWFNAGPKTDPVLKAAIAHLWFVTIHPFDDGNGRITRALTDMLLARADESPQRFYSMSAQILAEKNAYYDQLEAAQKGDRDITEWLLWFLKCLYQALETTEHVLAGVLARSRFWERHIDTPFNARQQLMLRRLTDGFFGKLTSAKWAAITKTSADTALRDIQDLIAKGVLEQEAAGGRSTSFRLRDV